MKSKLTASFLFVSGLLLLGIGSAILFAPEAFHASNGIELEENSSLLSEVRAPGGLLAASALLILYGAFRQEFRPQGMLVATFVYGSFGLARLVGMVLDGMPSGGIVGATVLELIVAALGLAILKKQCRSTTAAALTEQPNTPVATN